MKASNSSRWFEPAVRQHGYWLNAERLRNYSIIVIGVFTLVGIVWISQSDALVDRTGKPLGYDFITFYSASKLALGGNVLGVFDPKTIFAMEAQLIPGQGVQYPWNYPPQYLLVVLPLALLPYGLSFLLWSFGGLGLYLLTAYRLAPTRLTLVVAAAFPATMWNLTHGQNGFLSMALLGGAMLLLERRPIVAGILIGLMTFKPHLGLLIPVALIFGRHWKTFAAATFTTILFAAASQVLVGTEGWTVFLGDLQAATRYVEYGLLPWQRMVSLFTGLRMLSVPISVAYGLQAISSLGTAAVIAWVWSREVPLSLRAAVLAAGAPLATPYVFDYDLAILAIPMALVAMDGMRRGWLKGDREVLIIAWLTPLVATNLAIVTGVHLAYPCVLALFLICLRRALAPGVAFSPATDTEKKTAPAVAS